MAKPKHFSTEVETIDQKASVADAALQMNDQATGALIVLDAEQRPVGIITDRDLTIRVVANGLQDTPLPVMDVMSQPLVTAGPDDTFDSILAKMQSRGIRRVPIVAKDELLGIVALDDLLVTVSHQIHDVAAAAERELRHAQRSAAISHLWEDIEQRINQASDFADEITGQAQKAVQKVVADLRVRLQRGRATDRR